ncbi:HAD family hydrolase [Blastomonas sp.]|uniref:HAD family hydrolase n=1 Tax=Blastomonas sp. TaxID=1909299 RepID=UPI003593ED1F
MTTRIAIYDLDKTITVRPTYAAFLVFAALRLSPWRLPLLPLSALAGLGYLAKMLDRKALKQLNLRLLLGAPRQTALGPLARAYARQVVARNTRPGALAQIAADSAAGYRIVIASASFRLYVDAIARALDIADVIATDLRIGNGRVQPRIDGDNCYGAAKAAYIAAWLTRNGIDRAACHIRCYSDHVSDAPMLAMADEAFATNADPALRAVAAGNGWTIVDWPAATTT